MAVDAFPVPVNRLRHAAESSERRSQSHVLDFSGDAKNHEVGCRAQGLAADRESSHHDDLGRGVKTLLNVLWLVLAGLWLAISYAIAGAIMFLTIIGIPFGLQAFKLAGYALWPFGRGLAQRPDRHKAVSVIGNILWFVLAGWWLALEHIVAGILLCVTIVGIPLGIGSFKMAAGAVRPMGRVVVRKDKALEAGAAFPVS
jgi:uncharacterized membrane protein YccF (DUF307 family)